MIVLERETRNPYGNLVKSSVIMSSSPERGASVERWREARARAT